MRWTARLQVASFQAFLFQGQDLLLTLYLTFLPETAPMVGAAWAASSVWLEIVQLSRSMKIQSVTERIGGIGAYLSSDIFNTIDIPTLVLTTCAFTLAAIDEAEARWPGSMLHDSLLSVVASEALAHLDRKALAGLAVLFMWFRQLRLLALTSNNMSDLVQMLAGMLQDVLKFLALFVVVLFAFAAALATLLTVDDVDGAEPDCVAVMMRIRSVLPGVLMLFEATLTGDVNTALDCMRGAQRSMYGLLLLQLFMIISILLLLNMIIAIMGQVGAVHAYAARAQARAQALATA